MKKFEAVNKRNGRKFVITFEGEKIYAFDIEKDSAKEVSSATIKRWYELGEEIISPELDMDALLEAEKEENEKMFMVEAVMAEPTEEEIEEEIKSDIEFMESVLGEEIKQEKEKKAKKKAKLFWYEYRLRGFSLGCQPDGFMEHDDSIGKHGAVAYDRELTEKEISDYELNPMKKAKKKHKPSAVKKDGTVRKDKFRPKLVAEQVIEIREKYNNGAKKSHLAKEYNVSFRTITCIIERLMWKDVG